MTAENNNTFNHSRFVILSRHKFTKSQMRPITPTPMENVASCNEGGPDSYRLQNAPIITPCVKCILPSPVYDNALLKRVFSPHSGPLVDDP